MKSPSVPSSELQQVLDAHFLSNDVTVPFIITSDQYSRNHEVLAFTNSLAKWQKDGHEKSIRPVIWAPVPKRHLFRDDDTDSEADLIFAVWSALWAFTDDPARSLEAWSADIENWLRYYQTSMLIVSNLDNMWDLNRMHGLDRLVDKAAAIGCRTVLVGDLSLWLILEQEKAFRRHDYRPVNIFPPKSMTPEFAAALIEASRNSADHAVAGYVWEAAGGDRVQALALAESLSQKRYLDHEIVLSKEFVFDLAGITLNETLGDAR